ncbi:bifunctional riboflavin kinase/FAD synthetase [bacterium]|nr:bifunctional riboflavin kinase/FAD synthetase [bacterium]MDA7904855.1 bifunctional riboflavin kinase/FAD synthetase [Rhodopirellula sp.]MDA8968272.1 bifunctional riboflavin kinase/FAD synthetase [bacterium]
MTAIFSLQNVWPHDSEGGLPPSYGDSEAADSGETSDGDLSSIQGGVITIGNFDGVHRGHAALLGHVRKLADQLGGPAIAMVLDPHPATILRPDVAPKRLTQIETRAELMDQLGIDALVVCKTSRRFLDLSAEQFFSSLVQERLQSKAMIEGPNFFFGRNRGGNIEVLAELCGQAEIQLQIVDPMHIGPQMISSTRIRGLLAEGAAAEAAVLLGHPHMISGTVTSGAKRGREIGFPTANLTGIEVVVPCPGVYAGQLRTSDENHRAAIHIGPNPTFESNGDCKVEVHVLDYDGDLYDQRVQVDFLHRVRDVVRFESPDELVLQLHQDIAEIRRVLS